MNNWSSNASLANTTMISLLTKNPTLTYLHPFPLFLLEHGNYNNLTISPTTLTMTNWVVTKIVTMVIEVHRGLFMHEKFTSPCVQYKTGWSVQ
jgi:hypothetical protein